MATTPLPLDIPPGIVKTKSRNAAKGRFTDCDHTRFVNGHAEKWKGWKKLVDEQMLGVARGATSYSNVFGSTNAAFGTHRKLYALTGNDNLMDITPIRATGTLGNDPFAVEIGSAIVTVTHANHGLDIGAFVTFDGATAGGGITVDGEYEVLTVPGTNTYTIQHSAAATSTDTTTGGAAVTYAYEINPGLAESVVGLGWGAGGWNEGTWGTPRDGEGITLDLRVWSPSEYGNELLASHTLGRLYLWEDQTDARAELVTNSPASMRASFVTGERFPIALGTTTPMTLSWPDRDDITDWTPTANNTANTRTLQSGSKLIAGMPLTDGVNLIWSDTSLYVFQYTGSEFIYDDRLAGTNCGLIAQLAFCKVSGQAFWMSGRGFYMYAAGVLPIPNQADLADFVFEDMDPDHIAKTWCEYDQFNNQVRWHYVSRASLSGEPDKYVDVNIGGDWAWTPGTWPKPRTTGTVFRPADASSILVDEDGYLYSHNEGLDDDETPLAWSLTWGLFALSRGAENVDVMGIIPDTERQVGDVTYRVFTKDRPNSADLQDEGSVTMGPTEEIGDLRVNGRHFSMTATSNVLGGDVRIGIPSLEVQSAGKRR